MEAPVRDMLARYIEKSRIRMHMPGGKGKTEYGPLDVTETAGTDNLNAPAGAIAEGQRLLAEACGAARSFFLVGGASQGLACAVSYAASGGKLLLPRSAHRKCVHALALCGGEAVWMDTPYDEKEQLYRLPEAERIDRQLASDPEIRAVLVTTPDYYGLCCDIEKIARVVHKHGKLLLADEAHGAHFPYSPLLPPTAGAWADIWVQSAHKTLSALTQGAYLHAADTVDGEELFSFVRLYQTTSPSFPIVCSLDEARAEMQEKGAAEIARLAAAIEKMPVPHNGVKRADMRGLGVWKRDFTRLVYDVRDAGLTGPEAEKALREKGIYIEMADLCRIVAISSIYDTEEELAAFARAVGGLPPSDTKAKTLSLPPLPEKAAGIREAVFGRAEQVPLAAAAGRVCASVVGAYPPGASLIVPGERFTRDLIEYIRYLSACGLSVMGAEQDTVRVMK